MAQPTQRSSLTTLTRVRLLELADLFALGLPRATAKPDLIEALAHAPRPSFADLLDALKRDELKDICRAHGLADAGRDKAPIIARLLGQPAVTAVAKRTITGNGGNYAVRADPPNAHAGISYEKATVGTHLYADGTDLGGNG